MRYRPCARACRSPPRRRRPRTRPALDSLASGADASTGASAGRAPLARPLAEPCPPCPPRPRPPRRRRAPPGELLEPPEPPAPTVGAPVALVGDPGRVSPICGAGRTSPIRGPVGEVADLLFSSLTTDAPCVLMGPIAPAIRTLGSARDSRGGIGAEGTRDDTDRHERENWKANQHHRTGLDHVVLETRSRQLVSSRALRFHAYRAPCTATPHGTRLHLGVARAAIRPSSPTGWSSWTPRGRRSTWSRSSWTPRGRRSTWLKSSSLATSASASVRAGGWGARRGS